MKHTRPSRCRGLSLVELVYVIVVMGILGALMVPVVYNSLRSYEITRNQVATLDQIRYAMERMAREVREVRFTSAQEAEITTATATRMVFTRRAVFGGLASEVVTLDKTGTQITLAYGSLTSAGTQVLLGSVNSLSLVYLNENQAVMAMSSPPTIEQRAGVHAVQINLQVTTSGGQSLTRQTVVQLKNRALL